MKGQQGQVLLITLLVLSVATTIALSLVARTTTDVSISRQTEESQRAFSAAEAGIEEAMRLGGIVDPQTFQSDEGGASYTVECTPYEPDAATGIISSSGTIAEGDAFSVWLVDHVEGEPDYGSSPLNATSTVGVCWNGSAYAEIIAYYRDSGTGAVLAGRRGVTHDATMETSTGFIFSGDDPCDSAFEHGNSFTLGALGLTAGDVPYLLRVRVLGQDSEIGIRNASIPSQGNFCTSCGEVGDPSEPTVSCVSSTQTYPIPAPYFDFVVHSESTVPS